MERRASLRGMLPPAPQNGLSDGPGDNSESELMPPGAHEGERLGEVEGGLRHHRSIRRFNCDGMNYQWLPLIQISHHDARYHCKQQKQRVSASDGALCVAITHALELRHRKPF